MVVASKLLAPRYPDITRDFQAESSTGTVALVGSCAAISERLAG
jgi:hypothetical protein